MLVSRRKRVRIQLSASEVREREILGDCANRAPVTQARSLASGCWMRAPLFHKPIDSIQLDTSGINSWPTNSDRRSLSRRFRVSYDRWVGLDGLEAGGPQRRLAREWLSISASRCMYEHFCRFQARANLACKQQSELELPRASR